LKIWAKQLKDSLPLASMLGMGVDTWLSSIFRMQKAITNLHSAISGKAIAKKCGHPAFRGMDMLFSRMETFSFQFAEKCLHSAECRMAAHF
jgi:hypothetical protein